MNRIRALREAQGIEQKMLAMDLKVSQPTVSSWETGSKQPSGKSTEKLADYFGVTIDYLMGRDTAETQIEDDVWELRERLRRQQELRLLFSATKKASKEDLLTTIRIFEALKENGHDDD